MSYDGTDRGPPRFVSQSVQFSASAIPLHIAVCCANNRHRCELKCSHVIRRINRLGRALKFRAASMPPGLTRRAPRCAQRTALTSLFRFQVQMMATDASVLAPHIKKEVEQNSFQACSPSDSEMYSPTTTVLPQDVSSTMRSVFPPFSHRGTCPQYDVRACCLPSSLQGPRAP